jgi:tRNA pseudouridine38-40 synthase
MLRNLRLILAYDGTDYHGWQRQPGVRTIQGLVEQSARRVLRHPLQVVGSGRTDAGVHARGQVAHLITTSSIPARNLKPAIGGRLPKDVTVIDSREVPLGFHASRSAQSKLYRYRVYNHAARPSEELQQRFTYHFWTSLDVERMRQAARFFVGRHDFAAMASKGSERETTVRTVFGVWVYRRQREVRFDVQGAGFLYNQVRNMVGTLLEVGRGHWPPEQVAAILASGDRTQAGPTAPARGLCLQWVLYHLPSISAEPPSKVTPPPEATIEGDEPAPLD